MDMCFYISQISILGFISTELTLKKKMHRKIINSSFLIRDLLFMSGKILLL